MTRVNEMVLRPRDLVEVTLPGRRWDELTAADGAFRLLGSRRHQTVWTVPLDVQRTPLEEIAAGHHDEAWAELGRQVAVSGRTVVVRIVLPSQGDPARSAAAFRRAASAVRRTPGVAIEWGVPAGIDPTRAGTAWPGDDVVDLVGVEATNRGSWAADVAGPGGLADWSSWARAHDKRLAVHWTLDGQDPLRVRRMADWLDLAIRDSAVSYDSVSASSQADSRTLSTYRHLW